MVLTQYQVGDRVVLPERDTPSSGARTPHAPREAKGSPHTEQPALTRSVRSTGAEDDSIPNAKRDLHTATDDRTIRKPDGTELLLAADAKTFDGVDQPGVYHLVLDGEPSDFAVNLAASESKTAPLDLGELQQLGVRLGRQATRTEAADKRRQMRDVELEGRQKLWQWLVAAALAVLIVETWLAGYLTRFKERGAGVVP